MKNTFLHDICVPFLLRAQNPDGGWGYRSGLQSRVEPTAWAVAGLDAAELGSVAGSIERGKAWLEAAQLPDGSWPCVKGQQEGGWVTAVGCLALGSRPLAGAAYRAARWLCAKRPGDGGLWWRMRARMFPRSEVLGQDPTLHGWSWTQRTSSWVEPTALALLALRPMANLHTIPKAAERRQLAEAMLLNRMCPEGGWNCGNPKVYGNPGRPLVGPTAWALLALRDQNGGKGITESLAWLEGSLSELRGPASLALACLSLRSYGREVRSTVGVLELSYGRNEYLWQVPVMAWAALALGPLPAWARRSSLPGSS